MVRRHRQTDTTWSYRVLQHRIWPSTKLTDSQAMAKSFRHFGNHTSEFRTGNAFHTRGNLVCYPPMPSTHSSSRLNSGQSYIAKIGYDIKKQENSSRACFTRRSPIAIWEPTTEPYSRIVVDRLRELVKLGSNSPNKKPVKSSILRLRLPLNTLRQTIFFRGVNPNVLHVGV